MSKKRRLSFVAIAAAVFAAVYSLGAAATLSDEEAREIKESFGEQVRGIDAIGIFLNNFRIAAAMFIPAFGVFVGLFSAYSTGVVFKALAQTTPQIANVPPLVILATPFGLMEVFSYGVAMSQSALLINAIIRKKSIKPLIIPTIILIGIVAAVLFAGAFIEFYLIEALPPEIEITENV
ncbi:MAG: stage II sporulation protein M [Nitrososphaerales archaeon]